MNKISSIPILVLISLLASCKISESMAWVVSTIAGSGATGGYRDTEPDETGTDAKFNHPYGVAVDSSGNIYVADSANHRIRKITKEGVVSTIAGSTQGYEDTEPGETGTDAKFKEPLGVAADSEANVYATDQGNHRIRKITPAGMVTTLAGTGTAGFADDTGDAAQFYLPFGVAVDSRGSIYVADTLNHCIRKLTSKTVGGLEVIEVNTIAGSGDPGFANGVGTTAQFKNPSGVVVDSRGKVYVADRLNHRIREITPAGVVTTIAGTGDEGFANGPGTMAQFHYPTGVAMDSEGNIYVADYGNNRIRKITPAGVVSTIAGTGKRGFADDTGIAAQFNDPTGVAVDSSGNVYVADFNNHRIRKLEYKVP